MYLFLQLKKYEMNFAKDIYASRNSILFLVDIEISKPDVAICTTDEVIATQRRCYEIPQPVSKNSIRL